MNKTDAEEEVVRRWRALPMSKRKTVDQVLAFGSSLAGEVTFDTLGDPKRIIVAWLLREFQASAAFTAAHKSKAYPTI
jgi:hypothetical protein